MEILQFLLTNFFGDRLKTVTPIINLLRKNNFDLSKCVSELTPEMLAPVVEAFTSAMNDKKSPTSTVGHAFGTSPIAKIADKEIVYTLNKYLCD